MESSDEIENYLKEVKNQISSILNESNSAGCGCEKPSIDETKSSTSQSKNKTNSKTFGSKLASSSKKIHPEKNEEHFSGINSSEITPIEVEIDSLRNDLKRNYDIFENARDMLSELSFEMLSDRIKDLHMYPDDSKVENIVEKFPMSESLDQLTDIMKDRLNNHPGEFGGIPEISTFFKICSKLKVGMENLQEQSKKLKLLEQRINCSINVSGETVSNIRSGLERDYSDVLEKVLLDAVNSEEDDQVKRGALL